MWKQIQIQSNCVETETEKAVLINLPKTSSYKGYSFWHPSKLCRSIGKNGWMIQISFTEDFVFKLKKYGKGQYNWKQILDEKEIGVTEISKAFGFGSDAIGEDLSDLEDE